MIEKTEENLTNQLLSVQQAAEYLGVHTGTIRRWAYDKRLEGSKIGIRGDWRFKEEALKGIMRNNNSSEFQSTMYKREQPFVETPQGSHFVHFYEDDTHLVQSIRQFINSGDTAIVVVTPEHKIEIEKNLTLFGLDLELAIKNDNYIALDAETTLSKFMVNNIPDENLFFEVIGGIITRASRKGKNITVFGEMVAILWQDGNKEAAIRLEELWNELQKIHKFTLFCAYPIHSFDSYEDTSLFETIGKTHSHVTPGESYSDIKSDDQKLRDIAILQQKAQVLEATLENLRVSEEFNRRIIENSADCIKVLDLRGKMQSMNQPGCKAFEIDDMNTLIGKDYRSFWRNEYLEVVNQAIETACNGGTGRFQGFCPTMRGTPKWWDVVISPMYDNKGKIYKLVAISRDITSIKELEQRKDDFMSATSHELKTPLTSQKAYLHILKRSIEDINDMKLVRYINKVDEQSSKLITLVNDLLDVSKIHSGKLKLNVSKFDLNQCISEEISDLQTISSSHKLNISGNISQLVYADKEKISQVIINLVTNAVKYSPNSNKVDIFLKKYKNKAIISIRDYGIGIATKYQNQIFDRFFRIDDKDEKTYPGLGMGLYISSEIIKQHGSSFSVKSVKGKGSTFSFTLPIAH